MEEKYILVGRYQYTSEALIYKGKLESEGVDVFIRDNNTVDANPLYSNAIGGVKLFVNREDEKKTYSILSQISEFSLDENNQLMKCPKCGAEEIDMITSVKDIRSLILFMFSMLLVLLPFYSKHKYKCRMCNFEFN
ncbi:MAG: putative RNA-binding Zn-ribbon protein involved in translation (DUF1610 family) [Flavobacterium sp.]|jgi:predicted RNA-binding Zn-ribbon protein involved in translation (DUF1610 family)